MSKQVKGLYADDVVETLSNVKCAKCGDNIRRYIGIASRVVCAGCTGWNWDAYYCGNTNEWPDREDYEHQQELGLGLWRHPL